MGTNSQPRGEIELYREGMEEPVRIKIADTPEIKLDFKETENEAYSAEDNWPMSINVEIPKSLRCTSRKRFVKLLMSCGIERNAAIRTASMAEEFGISYQTHLLWTAIFLEQASRKRSDKK